MQNAEENQAKTLNEYEDELNKYISGTVKETFKGTTVADAIQYGDVLNKDDNTELHDAYGNKIVVPAGFKITNDATTVDKGIVIEDVTSGATAGSQFVWVPVGKIYTDTTRTDANSKTINLNRYTFNENGNPTAQGENIISNYYQELSSSDKGTTVSKNITDFKNSVSTNGGYYIGRYEARTINPRTDKGDTLAQITEKGTDQVYNFVTQIQAASQAKNMYNSSNFTSDLMNSYAWDTAILFLQNCGTNKKYSKEKNGINTTLSPMGTTTDKQCNIFDMANNVLEWITETSSYDGFPCVHRGGSYYYKNYCTSSRGVDSDFDSSQILGFRPLLYLDV